MNAAEFAGESDDPFEEVVTAARDAQEIGHLTSSNGQSGAGLETDENAFADEAHQDTEPQEPGDEAEEGHCERRQRGDLDVTVAIATGHDGHGASDHQRDGRGRSDSELA